ncbi:MAG: hypothetical protein ISN29_04655 [Gammaproteobacteria bacterium AqS3]|nr:hypothetical protein [Gammaproteobacteria bacterium AqS3]
MLKELPRRLLRTPLSAAAAAIVLCSLPLVCVLGMALAVSVLLRHGVRSWQVQAAMLAGCAIQCGLSGEPTPLLLGGSVLLAACTLRIAGLDKAVLALPFLGLLAGALLGEWIGTDYLEQLRTVIETLSPKAGSALPSDPNELLGLLVQGMGLTTALLTLAVLLLGLHWQDDDEESSELGESWRALRLPMLPAVGLTAAFVLGSWAEIALLSSPLILLPLLLGGLGLLHWLGHRLKLGGWVFLIYPLVLLVQPVVGWAISAVGLADAQFDLRAQLVSQSAEEAEEEEDQRWK